MITQMYLYPISRKARCFVISLLLTVLMPMAGAAMPNFIHLNSKSDGLSYDAVKCMCQDSFGFVWIGTQNGLNRWDGSRMDAFGHDRLGIRTDYIRALCAIENGNVLIGTDDGLVLYDRSSDSFSLMDKPCQDGVVLSDRVFSIIEEDGGIWIGVRNQGLFKLDYSTKAISHISLPKEIKTVYRLAMDSRGDIFLASYCKDVYRYSPKDGTVQIVADSEGKSLFLNDDVEGLATPRLWNGILYVASKKSGLCEVNLKTGGCRILYSQSEPSRYIDLIITEDRWLWLSTASGLVRYDLEDASVMTMRSSQDLPFFLSDDFITCALPLSNGDLWVGTEYSGVNYYGHHQDAFSKVYSTQGGVSLKDCIVRSFSQDENGRIWIGTEYDGLLRMDSRGSEVKRIPIPAGFSSINAICADGKSLWIGADRGLTRFVPNKGGFKTYPILGDEEDLRDNRVVSFFRSRESELYVSTALGVFRYDRNGDTFVFLDAIGDVPIEDMVQDGDGNIWMASYNDGLYGYNPQRDEVFRHLCSKLDDSPVPEMTSSLCLDGKGNLWIIGFSNGFCKMSLRTGDIEQYNRASVPSLPTDVYFSALTDDKGHLWLSSDKGLVEFLPETKTVKRYSEKSGLLDDAFKKSCLKDRFTGDLYFGSSNGFISFSPRSLSQNEELAKVFITDFTVKGETVKPSDGAILEKNVDLTSSISLPSSLNSFGLRIAVPSASALAGCTVICRLVGFETAWRNITESKDIYYYNVPPGEYSFELRSVAMDGRVSWEHPHLSITVKPPFWWSKAGIILLLSIIAMILLGTLAMYQYFYNRHKEKALYKEKMQFFTNVIHEIKTPLTLISTPLHNLLAQDDVPESAREDLSLIETSTDYMDTLVKDLLEFIRIEEYGYIPEAKEIDLIKEARFICSNFSSAAKERNLKLNCRFSDESLVCSVDAMAFDKILNNLLSNAVKYSNSIIEVEEENTKNGIVFRFRNDGPPIPASRREAIFKPFVQFSGEHVQYSQSFGIGLSHAKTLAQVNGGSLILSDSDQTEFVLTLPYSVNSSAESAEPDSSESSAAYGKALILVVEDNMELLSYLKSKLKTNYSVKGASSAEAAWDIVKNHKVDLVITDLALKGMSGLALLKRIHSTPEVDPVPVIVISAITSADTKVACLNAGASMYLEKPFTMDYLYACIKGTIERESQFKSTVVKDKGSSPIVLPNRDADFLARLNDAISQNIGNPSFSISELENTLYMSRSALNRKMKALLDTTPREYLRHYRIEKAAGLLQVEGARVSEVAELVGFTSASYFARCFKQQYGCLPTEYNKRGSVA